MNNFSARTMSYNCPIETSALTTLMRICFISREYPPDTGWGGIGAYTYYTANALAARGHDVEVISLAGAEGKASTSNGEQSSVKIHRVEWQNLLDELNLLLVFAPATHFVLKSSIALWKKFLEIHEKHPFDVVETPEHLAAGIFHGVTAVAPLVVKLHTPHSMFVAERFHNVLPSLDHQLCCLLERITMLSADILCSPSEDLAKFVSADVNLPPGSIAPVRNPVDTDKFNPAGNKALPEDDRYTVLFVGRLEERKGIHYLVEALPEIIRLVPNTRLVVVGADTNTADGGTSVADQLKRRLAELNCAQSVTFVPHVSLSEIPGYYRSADVCVVPSLYENAPYTCIEAMSCGKPVVATSAGGTREYLSHGKAGFVVPPRSPQELARAIVMLLKDGRLRADFGQAARLFIEEHCSTSAVAHTMEELYQRAIAQHATRKDRLYRKPVSCTLSDALSLLCAADKAIFDVLYSQSLDFKLKHWWRFLLTRPRLLLASLLVYAGRLISGQKHLPEALAALEQQIARKQGPRYKVADLAACRKTMADS